MNGVLYSAFTLRAFGAPALPKLGPDASTIDRGTHRTGCLVSTTTNTFDYIHESVDADKHKVYVPTRGTSILALRVGEASSPAAVELKAVVQNLLVMNSSVTPEEQASNTYLSLAFSKVFQQLSERAFIVLNVESAQPKFVILTKGVPVFSFALVSDTSSTLVWSNDPELDTRLKKSLGNSTSLYRLPTHTEGVCVIQSNYLEKKFGHWTRTLRDSLKVMSALEAHLARRWLTPLSLPVNTLSETDHLAYVQP